MAKRSNNSLGRRAYGGKPYDANNSFVKKMANKVTDLIPQRSWISKWFNASQDNGDTSVCERENLEGADGEEDEIQQPPSKRPRIRMDVTHPPGTFSIRPRGGDSSNENNLRKDPYLHGNETEQDFLEPSMAGPSGLGRFVSSTPAVPTDIRSSNIQRSELNCLIPSENNGASNGADDNSESSESTSGCSSLIPQTNRQEGAMSTSYHTNLASRKRLMDDKLAFAGHLQSPRCLFLDGNNRESLSSRRPSFNASMMNNTMERSSSLSSPFYSGNVTFGGANALGHYKRSRSLFNSTNEFQLKVPRRTSVQVKPSNSECIDASGMSQTAKRILEAMEYFSSPISDAKKIPVKKGESTPVGGKKRSRDESMAGPTARVGLRHLTRELAVPTVPEMLKLRRRQKLQDTTVAARKIVSAMSGPPPGSASATSSAKPAVEEYHLRTEQDKDPKYHGKLRAKSKKNPDEDEPAPSLNLPRISLAITSLPSFEPLPKYTKPPSRETTVSAVKDTDNTGYKFASPIKMSEAAWNLKSINNFSFSKPLIADAKDDSRDCNLTSTTMSAHDSLMGSSVGSVDAAPTNFMWTGSSTAPRLKTKTRPDKESSNVSESSIAKASSELKSGSVMDILGGKNSTTEGSVFSSQKTSPRSSNFSSLNKSLVNFWECNECYIKNDSSEKVCVACKASKPNSTTNKFSPQASSVPSNVGKTAAQQPRNIASSTEGFGSQFKMSNNQWECSSCLVRNKQTDLVCASCTSPKPSNNKKVPSSDAVGAASSQSSAKFDLMDKFKPAEGSWECPGCMLRNPSTVITCPCCNASKPSSLNSGPKKSSLDASANNKLPPAQTVSSESSELMNKFRPATSSWECSSCLVRNNETSNSCVCCSNPKPNSSTSSTAKSSTTTTTTTTSGWGDKFKKPEGAWSCDSCMVQNKTDVTECVACGSLKPGATPSAPKSNFTFGIPANAKTETSAANGFSLGAVGAKSSNTFTFGIPPSESEKNKSSLSSTIEGKPSGFVFAAPKSADVGGFKFEAKANASETSDLTKSSTGSQEKKETFVFGVTKQPEIRFGASSAGDNNGKPNTVFGMSGNGTDALKSNSIFGAATSEKSQPTSSNETDKAGGNATKSSSTGNEKQPETTLTTSLMSANSSSSVTAATSTAFSTETRSSFTFSEPNSKLRSQATIPAGFGETSMSSQPAVASSTFSIPAQKTSATTLNPENKQSSMSNFGMGKTGSMATPFGGAAPSSSPSPSPSLGESTTDPKSTGGAFGANANKPSNTFFGMSEEKKPSSAFGTVEKKPSMFGNVENKPAPAFECNDKPASNPIFNSPSPAFGQPAAASQQPLFGSSTTPVFGNSSSVPSFGAPTNADPPSIFGAAKPNVTSAPTATGLFTFGASAPPTSATPAPGVFNFTASASSANSAAKPAFSFGSAPGIGAPQASEGFASSGTNVGGTFGTPASLNPTPSPFTFNAPAKQDPPAFGQTSTAIPSIFGAQPAAPSIGQSQPASTFLPSAPASSTGFNFAAPAAQQPAASGGFNFGASMGQPASAQPSSGFNFTAAPSPAIAFDPNTPPSFNFTGGTAPTVFNATPQQPTTVRKIKKAVRRMTPR